MSRTTDDPRIVEVLAALDRHREWTTARFDRQLGHIEQLLDLYKGLSVIIRELQGDDAEPTPPRPTLTVINGDAMASRRKRRPRLKVITGGAA